MGNGLRASRDPFDGAMGKTHRSDWVFGSSTENNMNRPSRDQSNGVLFCWLVRSGCSSVAPLAGLMNRSDDPFRVERNTTWVASGDQTGETSVAGSNENLVAMARSTSVNQMSVLFWTLLPFATRFSSGARTGLVGFPSSGGPTVPRDFPVRSTQTSWRRTLAASRCTRMPAGDTLKALRLAPSL